jgi:hypothetical protein
VVEVYKLADELGVSSVEIIAAMEKLGVPVQLPNPSVSIDDAQRIRASFKKGSGFSFKNTSLFISAVVSLTLVLSINSDRVFADDTAPPQVITSSNSTVSEPTVSSLLSLKEQVVVASETIKDSFTVMVQEKLMDLGLLSGPATGVNDKSTQQAIKSFQEKAGLEVDGMVGPKTLPKLLLGEAAYTTTASLSTNSNSPVWRDDQLKFMRVNGTYLDVLWGHITHEKPLDTFQLYIDGELHSTIEANSCVNNTCSSNTSGMRFKIDSLKADTTYEFEVVACDIDGNCSNNNPTTTQSTVDKPPVWDESLPLTVSELGTRFNLNIPVGAATDDVEVSYYEVYVNHALSTFRTISDTRLFVLPKYDMTCGQQEVYVIAYDTIGQSSKSPTLTFTRNECGTAVATTTTTLPGTPSITITAAEVSDGDTSSDSSLSLTFTASASTTDFAAGDVSVSGGTLSNFSGSGTTYTATFTPTAQGATTIDVASSTFTDASTGVDNTAATQFNWTYSTAPTMTITAAEVSDGDTSSDSSLSLTFTASQSTTDFAVGDISVSNGTLSNFSGSGTTYTATFTPTAAGATTIDVAGSTFTNAFGTDNTATTQFNWTYTVASGKLLTCGDSTTNANRWVVAVIDEDDEQSEADITSKWSTFRASYPNRCFHLLEPSSSSFINFRTNVNGNYPTGWSHNFLPTDFLTEYFASSPTAFWIKVVRDDGTPDEFGSAEFSDWWDLIGASVLPSGAKIGLCIDNSGSMTASTVQTSLDLFKQNATAAGVTIVAPSGGNQTYFCDGMIDEDWITGLTVDIN